MLEKVVVGCGGRKNIPTDHRFKGVARADQITVLAKSFDEGVIRRDVRRNAVERELLQKSQGVLKSPIFSEGVDDGVDVERVGL